MTVDAKILRIESLTKAQILQLKSELKASEIAGVGTVVSLPGDVLFDFDKWNIRNDAKDTLKKVALLIQNSGDEPVEINGHTDNKGTDEYNQVLSEKRAESVKNYLSSELSIPAARLTSRGFGETKPVAPNTLPNGEDNPSGRQLNRRVEIVIRQSN